MKVLRTFFAAVAVCLITGCDPHAATLSDGQPMPSLEPGKAKGFANPHWFGKEVASKIDPVLTRRNFCVVLDGSGSMSEGSGDGHSSKIDAAKKAVKVFASKLSADDNVGLCAFDSAGVTERVALGINNRTQFSRATDEVRDDAGTPLDDAVALGYKVLREQAKKQLGYGEYYLIIVTDGAANPGHDPTAIVEQIVAESPVIVYTIGFRIGKGHSLNRPGLTIYKEANNPDELSKGLGSVLAESESFKDSDFNKK